MFGILITEFSCPFTLLSSRCSQYSAELPWKITGNNTVVSMEQNKMKMNDPDVLRLLYLLVLLVLCFVASLCSFRVFIPKMSRPLAMICCGALVGIFGFAILYMLSTGTSAGGFLD